MNGNYRSTLANLAEPPKLSATSLAAVSSSSLRLMGTSAASSAIGFRSVPASPASTATTGASSYSSTYRGRGGLNSTLPPAPLDAENRFPERPSAETKLRLVFEELDLDNSRSLTREGFRRTLQALDVDFTDATLDDLFDRMTSTTSPSDKSGGGRASYTDYLNWSRHYPALIEALYDRARCVVEKARLEAKLDMKRQTLEGLSQRERQAQREWQAAKDSFSHELRAVDVRAEQVQEAKSELHNHSQEIAEAERSLEYSKSDRNLLEKELNTHKVHEKNAAKLLKDLSRAVEEKTLLTMDCEREIASLGDQERELENALAKLREQKKMRVEQLGEAELEVAAARQEEEKMTARYEEVQATLTKHINMLRDAERSVEKEKERMDAILSARTAMQREIQLEEERIASLRGGLKAAEDEANRLMVLQREAADRVDQFDEEVKEMEHELADYNASFRDRVATEMPILENEIRLREQRYNLTERDSVHWDETTKLMQVTQRSDNRTGIAGRTIYYQR